MNVFEITAESPAYEKLVEVWSLGEIWQPAWPELEQLIEAPVNKNLGICASRLMLADVPEHLGRFFTQRDNNGFKKAKMNSEIHKKFMEIVDKYQLKDTRLQDVAFVLGTAWHRGTETYYPPMNGKYYFETERQIENNIGLHPIAEAAFLRLRAGWMETNEKEAQHE